MTIKELKKAKDERPFRPFLIHMSDGRELKVPHPDAVAWENDDAEIAVCMVPGGGWEVIDVILITSLGIAPPTSARRKGAGK